MDELEKSEEKRFLKGFSEKPFFSIFGFDLYLDDILILCILFSMYKDGKKTKCFLCVFFSFFFLNISSLKLNYSITILSFKT